MGVLRLLIAALVVGQFLIACGPERYEGPLYVPGKDSTLPREINFTGAAGRSLRCDHEYYSGGLGEEEQFPTAGSPAAALRAYAEHRFGAVPTTGFELVRKDEERALFVYDVDGETKAAVVVVAQIPGRWTMEAVAYCDPAEFAPSADAELGHGIWTDRHGNRVPTKELTLIPGHEHCGRESATFLYRFAERRKLMQYVRDPEGVATEETRGSYAPDVKLPADAEDSGYRLDDWQLWYAADRSAAYVVTPDGVERWPRSKQPIGCL